jgi:hypothetical protein
MEEYPTTSDYREVIEEYLGRDRAQEMLRNRKMFFVHTNRTEKVADISRRILFGFEDTEKLRSEAMGDQSGIKSTAFAVRSSASDEEIEEDL